MQNLISNLKFKHSKQHEMLYERHECEFILVKGLFKMTSIYHINIFTNANTPLFRTQVNFEKNSHLHDVK